MILLNIKSQNKAPTENADGQFKWGLPMCDVIDPELNFTQEYISKPMNKLVKKWPDIQSLMIIVR